MMENITYGVAVKSDIPCLLNLLSSLFNIEKDFSADATKQKKGLELLINNESTATIKVARNTEGKVVGMVTAQLVISTAQGTPSAWIEDMVVDTLYRGHGIGKQLLQEAITWSKENGASR